MNHAEDRPSTLKVRTVFISDVHLGTPGCRADALLDFLRDLAVKARPFAERDIADLRAFAAEQLGLAAAEAAAQAAAWASERLPSQEQVLNQAQQTGEQLKLGLARLKAKLKP